MSKKPKSWIKRSLPLIMGVAIAIIGVLFAFFWINYQTKTITKQDYEYEQTSIENKSSLSEILFGKANIKINFAEKYKEFKVEKVSDFEIGENWQGDGYYDKRTYHNGEASITIVAEKEEKVISKAINSKESINDKIKDSEDQSKNENYKNLKFIEFYTNISDPQNVESFKIRLLGDDPNEYYIYNITNLSSGWIFNRLPVSFMARVSEDPDFDINQVNKIEFSIKSRLGLTSMINIDDLKFVYNKDFIDDWNLHNSDTLTLNIDNGGNNVLEIHHFSGYNTILKRASSVNDFVYDLQLAPQRGRSGAFFRGNYKTGKGYYFFIKENSNIWSLMSLTSDGWQDIKQGKILNFNFRKDNYYWLRIEAEGPNISLFISLDGDDYKLLTEVVDEEYSSGGLGIACIDKGYSFIKQIKIKH